jgi:hypothetical protein
MNFTIDNYAICVKQFALRHSAIGAPLLLGRWRFLEFYPAFWVIRRARLILLILPIDVIGSAGSRFIL